MRKFSLLLISTFALAVSIPNSASSGELIKDDCGWVTSCPGQEEPPSPCPEGQQFVLGGLGSDSCVPSSELE